MSQKCVVIGAGALGASVAVELAAAGAGVTVVDAGRSGSGATGSTFAWVGASHPGLDLSADYLQLNMLGVAAHRRWSDLWGDRRWFARTGCLTWHTPPHLQAAMVDHVQKLRAWSYPAAIISPNRATERLEPSLRFDPTVEAVGWFPDEGFALGRPMVGDMLAVAGSLGARIQLNDAAVGIRSAADRVSGVELGSGELLQADTVIAAGGSGNPAILQLAGAKPLDLVSAAGPESLAVGLLVTSSPLDQAISRVVVADELMMRPDGGGRLMLHRDAEDRLVLATTPTVPAPGVASSLLQQSTRYLTGTATAFVESARIGIRPLAMDYLPVVGWATGMDGLYVMLTHSGITLAPVLAELVAAEVTGGREQSLLGSFRPQRFD